jgi:hypothetical protein
MNLELDLLELNALYVAVSNHVKKTQRDAENYPSDFFQTQATLAEMLAEKIQLALYEKCDELDINFESDDDDELTEKEEWLENRLSEDSFPHYVTNEEANEDDNNDFELESLKLQLAILNDELSHYVNKRDFTMANRISDQIEELEERIEELK